MTRAARVQRLERELLDLVDAHDAMDWLLTEAVRRREASLVVRLDGVLTKLERRFDRVARKLRRAKGQR